MNQSFKQEFKKLNKEELKNIVNGCAGRDVLEEDCYSTISVRNYSTLYNIIYVDNEDYGFWVIEWNFKKFKNSIHSGCGYFDSRIKLTPFKIEFENVDILTNSKKQLEEYLYININKKCPHYKQAVIEETEKFFKTIEFIDDNENKM